MGYLRVTCPGHVSVATTNSTRATAIAGFSPPSFAYFLAKSQTGRCACLVCLWLPRLRDDSFGASAL
jgi:hypothetical protein